MKKTPAVIAGVFLLFQNFLSTPAAYAAVPNPAIALTASPSKISGTSWTNDGSIGGIATLSTAASTAPTFQSSDSSVAINESANTNQFITQSVGNSAALSDVTFQIDMNLKSSQANSAGPHGMILGWSGVNYDIWYQGGCLGFNTGTSEVFGFNNSSNVNSYHTYTFVMSTTQNNTSKQKIFVDGIQQTLSYCYGTTSTQAMKSFGSAPSSYTIGRYGSNGFYGTFNLRSFKLWTTELTEAEIKESYNSQLIPLLHTIALTSGLNTAVYRSASTLRSTTDVEGKVTFFFNGKKISGCIKIQTLNRQANCAWKPSALNYNNISARLVSPGGSLTTSILRIFVTKRTGFR